MRKIKKGKVNKAVMAAVARNYDCLKRLCAVGVHGIYGGEGFEDIFQDTVLYVIQDRPPLHYSRMTRLWSIFFIGSI